MRCPLCEFPITNQSILDHLNTHSNLTYPLKRQYNPDNMTHCQGLALNLSVYENSALRHHEDHNLYLQLPHALTCNQNCNPVDQLLIEVHTHTQNSILNLDHPCILIPLYLKLILNHEAECSSSDQTKHCPLALCNSTP